MGVGGGGREEGGVESWGAGVGGWGWCVNLHDESVSGGEAISHAAGGGEQEHRAGGVI